MMFKSINQSTDQSDRSSAEKNLENVHVEFFFNISLVEKWSQATSGGYSNSKQAMAKKKYQTRRCNNSINQSINQANK